MTDVAVKTFTVSETEGGKRIDLVVGERLQLSRAKLRELFDAESVRLGGRKAKKGLTVQAGQVIEVREVVVPVDAAATRPDIELRVLHEDDALLFVDKPSGAPSQGLTEGEGGTVAAALLRRDPQLREVSTDPREAGLCHRLDIETSGVILAAKTREAWLAMRAAFSADGDIDKRYLALVTGPLADSGDIELPLAHRGDHVRPALPHEEARPASSSFQVLARAAEFSFVEVRIFTGVLHQVRAHLAAVGAPIVGDTQYGGRAFEGLQRFFLHAASLTVTHPNTGRQLTVKSALPDELEAALARAIPGWRP